MTAASNKISVEFDPEKSLRQNGHHANSPSENSSELVVLVDAQGRVTYVGPSITPLLGFAAEEVVGQHARIFVHPDDLEILLREIDAPGHIPGKNQRHEYRLRSKEGTWRWFEGSEINLLQVPGVNAIVSTFHSIEAEVAERKSIEEALYYLAAIVESSDDAILSKDLDGIITSWNAAAERMYGYSAQEIIGRPVSILFLSERQDEFTQIMTRIRHGEAIDHFETKRVRKDGVILTVSVTVSPIRNRSGDIIGASAIARDITEQRRLEAKFRQLFESNLIGVFVADFADTFLDANDAFLDLLGYTRAELFVGTIQRETLLPPENRFLSKEVVEALQESGSFGPYEKEYRHKSGQLIPVLVAVTRIEQTETCLGFVLDITERKELEKRKDEFISMASHELKTPLTSLKGFLSLLRRNTIAQNDERPLYYINRMETQINKLTKLINDLLDISRMQIGKLSYQEEAFAIDLLIREIMENVQETTQTHHLLLEGEAQAEVLGDRDRIGQVLINLLNNAIKYSPHADAVRIRASKDPHKIMVSVQDFGIGIAKEHQRKIFERLYQVTDPSAKTYPGLGIGLYISNEIVRRHGGKMWVESQKGQGSTFHFTLPLHREEERKLS